MFDNLLDNALKYTPTGGKVVVTDRGGQGGLRRDGQRARDPAGGSGEIRTVLSSRQGALARGRGTGLGLSIVKHLVQWLDGTIELDSTPGVGSTFRVSLNLAPVD